MLLHKEFTFEAAHFLPAYHGKCERLHGHTYRFVVTIAGQPDNEGMIRDFSEVKKIVTENVLAKLDHTNLNDTIPNPSAENIAVWIWRQLATELNIFEIRVWETATSSVSVRQEDIPKM